MNVALFGATGKTGAYLLPALLERGHTVRALVRDAAKVTLTHPNLTVIVGDPLSAADVKKTLEGVDAIASALGGTKAVPDVCSRTTANIIAAVGDTPLRYALVSGAAVNRPGDAKGFADRTVTFLLRLFIEAMVADKEREIDALSASALRFTALRPGMLSDGRPRGTYRIKAEAPPSSGIDRADLATAVIDALADDRWAGKAPFIGY